MRLGSRARRPGRRDIGWRSREAVREPIQAPQSLNDCGVDISCGRLICKSKTPFLPDSAVPPPSASRRSGRSREEVPR